MTNDQGWPAHGNASKRRGKKATNGIIVMMFFVDEMAFCCKDELELFANELWKKKRPTDEIVGFNYFKCIFREKNKELNEGCMPADG